MYSAEQVTIRNKEIDFQKWCSLLFDTLVQGLIHTQMIFVFFKCSMTEGCYYLRVHNSKIPAEICELEDNGCGWLLYSTAG